MIANKYDPRLKKAYELEQTLASGEKILDELLEELKPPKKGDLSRQSWLITGPRGIGKSHLLSLLYHKILANAALSQSWQPVLFPEELFTVDSLYRLLLQVFDYIFNKETNPKPYEEIKKEFLEIKKIRITGNIRQKKEARHRLAKELYQLLVKLKKQTGKPLILMLENLQSLFRDQLPVDDVKLLRSFHNEHPDVLIIIGTALAVFNEIEDYGKPFYRFFRVRSMTGLDRQGVIQFLMKMAAFRNDDRLEQKIRDNRHFIYVYQLLTGGNPRLILFLYELLLDHDILDTSMIMEKAMELTPYFLDKTKVESGQRKLILEALATEAPAQTAGEIATDINEDIKSIAEQLKRLSAEGWIREANIKAENIKKNEVFFMLRDYFYRVWYQVRKKGFAESDILWMAELAVLLFARKEIEKGAKSEAANHQNANDHKSCFNMGNSYYKSGNYSAAYDAYSAFIINTTEFERADFFMVNSLKSKAGEMFNSAGELQQLLDAKSTISKKFESLCRLLLLGKFVAITEELDKLMATIIKPTEETKKLEFFLLASVLEILSLDKSDPELKLLLKYWVMLIRRLYEDKSIKKKFLEFIYLYVQAAGKEKIDPQFVAQICEQLYVEGIQTSELIPKIIEAIKNPDTREAQQWMTDPLFAAIIHALIELA